MWFLISCFASNYVLLIAKSEHILDLFFFLLNDLSIPTAAVDM